MAQSFKYILTPLRVPTIYPAASQLTVKTVKLDNMIGYTIVDLYIQIYLFT